MLAMPWTSGSAGTADAIGTAVSRQTLEGRHGDTYPDMTWEPKAAVADCYHG
jgi:hypothetical protein